MLEQYSATMADIRRQTERNGAKVEATMMSTFVSIAFLFILGAAVLFSTRPRRAER